MIESLYAINIAPCEKNSRFAGVVKYLPAGVTASIEPRAALELATKLKGLLRDPIPEALDFCSHGGIRQSAEARTRVFLSMTYIVGTRNRASHSRMRNGILVGILLTHRHRDRGRCA